MCIRDSSEALKGGENISPALDQQKDVYAGLFAQLETAMSYINNSAIAVQGDIMFNGDMEAWKRFANTLKMTMALRISDVDPSTAQGSSIDLFDDSSIAVQKEKYTRNIYCSKKCSRWQRLYTS